MKIYSSIILAALTLELLACNTPQQKNIKRMKANYTGRFVLSDDNSAKCEWPGSAVSINFEGKAISAVISDLGTGNSNKFGGFDNNYILPIVDGTPHKKIRLKPGKHSYILAENLKNGEHSIVVFKCTEAFIGTVIFNDFSLPDGGRFLPPSSHKKRFIEFIGDSVTCAYGNEAKDKSEGFAPITENNYYSYAAIAARKFNADYAAIAWSGKGIYRNYDCSTNGTILELYDKVLPATGNTKHNFKERVPQIVVINIGANDFAKPNLDFGKFVECYEKLITKVDNNYPGVQIILIGTSKNAEWGDKQLELLNKIKNDLAFDNLHILKLSKRNIKKNGYGADWHPSIKSHYDIAENLVTEINKMINSNIQIVKTNDKYWLVNNINEKFITHGVNCVLPRDWAKGKKYFVLDKFNNNYSTWAKAAWKRLASLGFNSAGAWCAEEIYQIGIPHTRVAWLGGQDGKNRLIDVFSDIYATNIYKIAEEQVKPYKNEIGLIGFFANNELPWYGEYGWPTDPMRTLFDRYMELPETSSGKKRLIEFIKTTYTNSAESFAEDWGFATEAANHSTDIFCRLLSTKTIVPKTLNAKRVKHNWAGVVADKYFSLARDAIKKYAPKKLFLGSRFAFNAYKSVFKACGKYADVVSINYYKKDGIPDVKFFDNVYALTKKPIMITEFSFCAMENLSGDSNSTGADVTVKTQAERAKRYKKYCEIIMRLPYVIGWDWFQYFDQPPGGRFDGENSNYGIVSVDDKIYKELTSAMKNENKISKKIHSETSKDLPLKFNPKNWAELRPVTFVAPTNHFNLNWLDFSSGKIKCPTWGDKNNGLKIKTKIENKTLVIAVNTGTGWGGGIDVVSNFNKKNKDKSVDIRGADKIIINAKIPEAKHFIIQLNESGTGEAGMQVYDGVNGADGESFTAVEMQGNGKYTDYVIDFKLLELREFFGNQRGNRNIDLQAIKSVAFYFPGDQGKIKILIKKISFIGN